MPAAPSLRLSLISQKFDSSVDQSRVEVENLPTNFAEDPQIFRGKFSAIF
jgi:hypothetical protein